MTYERLVPRIEKLRSSLLARGDDVSFVVRTPDGASHAFGEGESEFELAVRNRAGLAALASMDLPAVAEAYVHGDIEVEGDLTRALLLRTAVSDRHPLRFLWRLLRPLMVGQVRSDRQAIAEHYDYEQDFYLRFLDERHRCYSQAIFESDDEPLEDAMTRKLEFALDAVGVKPGDRVLDIGGGWGAFMEFAGRRGIQVTSLTISRESEAFLSSLIERYDLPCRVLRDHFLEHRPAQRYDAIVNLGVTEHLPDYRGTLQQYMALLKPGGRIYLDASATREKNDQSSFLARYIYPGNGSLLCLHEYLAEVAKTPLQVEGVYDDRHSYELTVRAWAERLDQHRDEIERRWGSVLYRKFRLYLWGCADAFERDLIQAYRMVLRLPERPSPKMRVPRLRTEAPATARAALSLVLLVATLLTGCEREPDASAAGGSAPLLADTADTTSSEGPLAGTPPPRSSGTAVDLIDPAIAPAVAGEDGWDYHQSAGADLDQDGEPERLVITARVEMVRGRPAWDDGQPWQVYVEEADGSRTYLYASRLQLGTLTMRVTVGDRQPPTIVLIEHLPDRLRLLEIAYGGPDAARATEVFSRQVDPVGDLASPALP